MCLPYMGEEAADEPPGSNEIRQLMQGQYFPATVGLLMKQYPDLASKAEDAVFDGVLQFLAKRAAGGVIEHPAAWIRTASRSHLLNLKRRAVRETTDEDLMKRPAPSYQPNVEDKDVLNYLKSLIERWPNARMRVITLLYLEAGYFGEPLSVEEAASSVSAILCEDVPWTSISKTRLRGLERLKTEILTIAEQTGLNPLTGEEVR
jgi:DNA-directed RNA polymerase specialized sigma24 family protein